MKKSGRNNGYQNSGHRNCKQAKRAGKRSGIRRMTGPGGIFFRGLPGAMGILALSMPSAGIRTPAAIAGQRTVISSPVANIYVAPVHNGAVIDILKRGDVADLIAVEGEWRVVRLPGGRLGWIHGDNFSPETVSEAAAPPKQPPVSLSAAPPPEAPAPPAAADAGVSADPAAGPEEDIAADTVSPSVARVRVRSARVRTGPGTDTPSPFGLLRDEKVVISRSRGDWRFIRNREGQTGWVHVRLLTDFTPADPGGAVPPSYGRADFLPPSPLPEPASEPASEQASGRESADANHPDAWLQVAVVSGRVREHPSLDAPVVFGLSRDAVVRLLERRGDWRYILTEGGSAGWAHRSLFSRKTPLVLPDTPSTRGEEPAGGDSFRVQVPVGRVRTGPDLSAGILFRLTENAVVTVDNQNGRWRHIRANDGRTGWIHQDLLAAVSTPLLLEAGAQELAPDAESVFFRLSGFHPPRVHAAGEGDAPSLVCDFSGVRLSPDVDQHIRVNGRYIRDIRMRPVPGTEPGIRAVLRLSEKDRLDVSQHFFRDTKIYTLTVRPDTASGKGEK